MPCGAPSPDTVTRRRRRRDRGAKPLTTHARDVLDARAGGSRSPSSAPCRARRPPICEPTRGALRRSAAMPRKTSPTSWSVSAAAFAALRSRPAPGTCDEPRRRDPGRRELRRRRGARLHGLAGEERGDAGARRSPVGSAPMTECPTNGTSRNWAPGIRSATARASVTGVRRSASPSSTSVGTLGSGPGRRGAGDAFGHETHSGMTSASSAMRASNGPSCGARDRAAPRGPPRRRAPAARRCGSTGRRPPRTRRRRTAPPEMSSLLVGVVEARALLAGAGSAATSPRSALRTAAGSRRAASG